MSFDDLVRLDSSNGDLAITTPDSTQDVWNFTGNVSLACFSQLARGDRSASDLGACLTFAFDLFTLQGLKVDFWPPRLFLPWEEGGSGGASAMTAPSLDGAVSGAAPHVDTTHHHDATIYPGEGFVFILSFFFLFLLVGVCIPYEAYPVYTVTAARTEPEMEASRERKTVAPLLAPARPMREDATLRSPA